MYTTPENSSQSQQPEGPYPGQPGPGGPTAPIGQQPEQVTKRGKGPTITLGICLAAGLAVGIGLMRPGNSTVEVGSAAAPTGVTQAPAQQEAAVAPGYGAPAADAPATGAPAPAPAPAPAGGAINISDFDFGAPITVAAGAPITVTNQDGVAHTLTADDGSFDTGNIGGGGTAPINAPTAPGTYSFFCAIHPSMQGTVTVTS